MCFIAECWKEEWTASNFIEYRLNVLDAEIYFRNKFEQSDDDDDDGEVVAIRASAEGQEVSTPPKQGAQS